MLAGFQLVLAQSLIDLGADNDAIAGMPQLLDDLLKDLERPEGKPRG